MEEWRGNDLPVPLTLIDCYITQRGWAAHFHTQAVTRFINEGGRTEFGKRCITYTQTLLARKLLGSSTIECNPDESE